MLGEILRDPARRLGAQIAPDVQLDLLGKEVEHIDLGYDVIIVAAQGGDPDVDRSWRFGFDGPIYGMGVLVGYDKASDSYHDPRMTIEKVHELVKFGVEDDGHANEGGGAGQ